MVSTAPPNPNDCPSDEQLGLFAEGQLDERPHRRLTRHIDECGECRLVVAALVADSSSSDSGEDLDDATTDAVPLRQRIARFHVKERLGSGGMGAVYLAFDPKLGREVAVKVLHPSLAEQHGQKLLSEARAMAAVSHPAVLPIYEVGEHGDVLFIAMEYVSGHNLRHWLHLRQPSWRRIVAVLAEAGRGLQAAHDQDLIHRDFKPDNVLVGKDDRVRVADFGLAKMIDPDEQRRRDPERSRTDADKLVGTRGFIAPEYLEGRGLSPAVDQYSFCVTLFAALFGELPFSGADDFEIHSLVKSARIAQVALGEIPAELHEVVCRGLAYRPEDRYPSMTDLLAALEPFARADEDDDYAPYPGLASFSEHDSRFYFGHDAALADGLARARRGELITVVGPSGAGKSSFVRAGLLAGLRRRQRWSFVTMRPGHSPVQSLARALDGPSPRDAVSRLLAHRGEPVLLVIDQLEELFTQCDDDAARQQLCDLLAELAADGEWGALVLCLRSDFLDELGRHRELAARATRGLVYLSPPDRRTLREAVTRPLELVGYRLEDPAIADELADELADRPGALPLLQFAMHQLWTARDRQGRQLTRSAYSEMGAVGGALAGHADRMVAALSGEDRATCKAILLRLVTHERTRDSVGLEELQTLEVPGASRAMLDALIDARLVVARGDDDVQTYELVHESLIEHWPTLRGWLDEQRDDAGYLRELASAARQWHGRGRPAGLLWRAEAADELASWWRQRGRDATLATEQRRFAEAVLRERRRARRRKRRLVIAALALLGVIAGGAVAAAGLIANAREAALEQAAEARRAADQRASAERKLRAQYEALQAEIAQRKRAEAKAAKAADAASLSREQLIEALQRTEAESQRARDAARRAEKAAVRERAAAREAEAARRQTQKLLRDKERELREALRRKKRIIDDL